MKKILIILFALVTYVIAADSTAVFHSDSMNPGLSNRKGLGVDVVEYVLFNGSANVSDTIAAGDYLILGPYPLHHDTRDGQFSYFNLVGQALAAGDTAQVAYQITQGNAITDTSLKWTAFDSVDAVSGVTQTVVDLTQKAGAYIWYQFYNITAGGIIMSKKLSAFFRKKLPIR